MQHNAFDVASQRVEHALRRFQESWLADSSAAISQDLDELDVAVGLWLDVHEAAEQAVDARFRHPAAVAHEASLGRGVAG